MDLNLHPDQSDSHQFAENKKAKTISQRKQTKNNEAKQLSKGDILSQRATASVYSYLKILNLYQKNDTNVKVLSQTAIVSVHNFLKHLNIHPDQS